MSQWFSTVCRYDTVFLGQCPFHKLKYSFVYNRTRNNRSLQPLFILRNIIRNHKSTKTIRFPGLSLSSTFRICEHYISGSSQSSFILRLHAPNYTSRGLPDANGMHLHIISFAQFHIKIFKYVDFIHCSRVPSDFFLWNVFFSTNSSTELSYSFETMIWTSPF